MLGPIIEFTYYLGHCCCPISLYLSLINRGTWKLQIIQDSQYWKMRYSDTPIFLNHPVSDYRNHDVEANSFVPKLACQYNHLSQFLMSISSPQNGLYAYMWCILSQQKEHTPDNMAKFWWIFFWPIVLTSSLHSIITDIFNNRLTFVFVQYFIYSAYWFLLIILYENKDASDFLDSTWTLSSVNAIQLAH